MAPRYGDTLDRASLAAYLRADVGLLTDAQLADLAAWMSDRLGPLSPPAARLQIGEVGAETVEVVGGEPAASEEVDEARGEAPPIVR